MEAVLGYLSADQPDAVVDAMCTGPDTVQARYGIEAVPLFWHHKYERQAHPARQRSPQGAGQGHRHGPDGVLGSPSRCGDRARRGRPGGQPAHAPRGFPYALFLLSRSGRIFGTKVAMVSVGAGAVNQPLTRWLFNSAARLAFYRSYRDPGPARRCGKRGLDVGRDHCLSRTWPSRFRRRLTMAVTSRPSLSASWRTTAPTTTASRRTRSMLTTSLRMQQLRPVACRQRPPGPPVRGRHERLRWQRRAGDPG